MADKDYRRALSDVIEGQSAAAVMAAVAYAAAHPFEAQERREREEMLYTVAFIIELPVKAAEPIIDALCAEFKLSMEGLRRGLLRGDAELWRSVETRKA